MQHVPGERPLASATSLNPSAGHHLVTADPRELAATGRAGERSWTRWTYYGRRYGERGRQFTRSDSAWLATLVASPLAVVEQQIRWLGAVLAARGMPRLLLEEHLEALHEELLVAVPERADEYTVLHQAASALRAERTATVSDAALGTLETAFRQLVAGTGEDDLRAGALIGAAVADEQAGVARAVESLTEWLADPARFAQDWCAAVAQTLENARGGVGRPRTVDDPPR